MAFGVSATFRQPDNIKRPQTRVYPTSAKWKCTRIPQPPLRICTLHKHIHANTAAAGMPKHAVRLLYNQERQAASVYHCKGTEARCLPDAMRHRSK